MTTEDTTNKNRVETIKRPSINDTEDDLLTSQQDFFKSREAVVGSGHPAAKSIRVSRPVVKELGGEGEISASTSTTTTKRVQFQDEQVNENEGSNDEDDEEDYEEYEEEDVDLPPLEGFEDDGKDIIERVSIDKILNGMQQQPNPVPTKPTAPLKKKSLFASMRQEAKESQDSKPSKLPQILRHVEAPTVSVISGIVERDVEPIAIKEKDIIDAPQLPKQPLQQFPVFQSGFPTVFHRSRKQHTHAVSSSSATSDFASLFRAHEAVKSPLDKQIHDENIGKLSSMTEEEMEEAHRQIMQNLNPALVDLLLKNAASKYGVVDSKKEEEKIESVEVKEVIETVVETDLIEAETEKMEWTIPVADDKASNKNAKRLANLASTYRFDFNGELLLQDKAKDLPTHLGLHHHGDHPELAGYTLGELLHLSRSTVASQRALALKTIGKILDRLNTHTNEDVTISKMMTRLREFIVESGTFIYLRVGLDDMSETCLSEAALALAKGFGYTDISNVFAKADTMFRNTSTGLNLLPLVPHVRTKFTFQPLRDPELDDEETNESSQEPPYFRLHKTDVINALLSTNILDRLTYLLTTFAATLPPSVVTSILFIILRIAQHSPNEVAETLALVPVLHDKFIAVSWPPATKKSMPSPIALRILATLVQAKGRKFASILLEKGILDDTMRYLSISANDISKSNPDLVSLCERLQVEALFFLRVCVATGVEGWPRLWTEYWEIFGSFSIGAKTKDSLVMSSFWALLAEVSDRAMEVALREEWCENQVIQSLSRFINDGVAVFTDDKTDLVSKLGVLRFFQGIVRKAGVTDEKVVSIFKNSMSLVLDCVGELRRHVQDNQIVTEKVDFTSLLIPYHPSRSALVSRMVDISVLSNFVSTWLDVCAALIPKALMPFSVMRDVVINADFVHVLNQSFWSQSSSSSMEWVRWFSIGFVKLQYEWIRLAREPQFKSVVSPKQLYSIALSMVSNAAMGCEDWLVDVIENVLFNLLVLLSLQDLVPRIQKGPLWSGVKILKDILIGHVRPVDVNESTNDKKTGEEEEKMNSFMVNVDTFDGMSNLDLGLPLPPLWQYFVIDDYSKLEHLTSDEAVLIEAFLQWLVLCETIMAETIVVGNSNLQNPAIKITNLMKVFLMNVRDDFEEENADGKEVKSDVVVEDADMYNRPITTEALDRLWYICVGASDSFTPGLLLPEPNVSKLVQFAADYTALSNDAQIIVPSKFYAFYSSLVVRYVGTSYGNPVFAKYLLHGLDTTISVSDLRLAFWSDTLEVLPVLLDQGSVVQNEQSRVFSQRLFSNIETDERILGKLVEAVTTLKLEQIVTLKYGASVSTATWDDSALPLLWKICWHHLSGWVFRKLKNARELGEKDQAPLNMILKKLQSGNKMEWLITYPTEEILDEQARREAVNSRIVMAA